MTTDLVAALADALAARRWRLATAESCTGGLIAAACTERPGSSDWFECGFVTYSNAAKSGSLDVPPALIAEHGAVSETVVRAMAQGALRRSHADWAVAVSGVAGPGGGSPDKPVGTVWLAWCGPGIEEVEQHRFGGDRTEVRRATVERALRGLLDRLAKAPA